MQSLCRVSRHVPPSRHPRRAHCTGYRCLLYAMLLRQRPFVSAQSGRRIATRHPTARRRFLPARAVACMATLQPRQLEAYLNRMQLPAAFRSDERLASADMQLLQQLIASHQINMPFENLSLVRRVKAQLMHTTHVPGLAALSWACTLLHSLSGASRLSDAPQHPV